MSNTRTFNQAAIAQWKKDLAELPGAIAGCETVKAGYDAKHREIQEQRRLFNESEVQPNSEAIRAINARLFVLSYPANHVELKQQVNDAQQHKDALVAKIRSVNVALEPMLKIIKDFETMHEVRQLEKNKEQLLEQASRIHAMISRDQEKMSALDGQYSAVSTDLLAAESRLSELRSMQTMDNLAHITHDHHHHHHNAHVHGANGFQAETSFDHGIGGHNGFGGHAHNNMAHQVGDMMLAGQISDATRAVTNIQSRRSDIDGQRNSLRREIDSHRRELDRNTESVRSNANRVAELQRRLGNIPVFGTAELIAERLQEQKKLAAPLQMERATLDTELQEVDNKLTTLIGKNVALERRYQQALPLSKPYETLDSVTELQATLTDREASAKSYAARLAQIDREIAQGRELCDTEAREIATLRATLKTAQENKFLPKLDKLPEELLASLTERLLNQLTNYENIHPNNQNVAVRLCLEELRRRTDYINNLHGKSVDEMREKYYQLCGLIYNRLELLHVPGNPVANHQLKGMLETLLRDDLVDKQEAIQAYLRSEPGLNPLTDRDLVDLEHRQYQTAALELQNLLLQIPAEEHPALRNLQSAGTKVLTSVQTLCMHAHRNADQNFDLKLHIQLLRKTAVLVTDPGNPEVMRDFEEIKRHVYNDKYAVLAKRILGALAIFVGAAIAAASVAALVFSFGVTAPISYTGIGVGGGLALTGIGTFTSSFFNRGLSHRMDNFKDANVHARAVPRQDAGPQVENDALLGMKRVR